MTEAACTLLLVEDDVDVRDALCEVLSDEGYLVATAGHGQEALEYLRSHPAPAVILLDLMMPVMNGYEFRNAQRADPVIAAIPVLCISAGAMNEGLAQMQVAGAFKKPLDLQELLDAIARHAPTAG